MQMRCARARARCAPRLAQALGPASSQVLEALVLALVHSGLRAPHAEASFVSAFGIELANTHAPLGEAGGDLGEESVTREISLAERTAAWRTGRTGRCCPPEVKFCKKEMARSVHAYGERKPEAADETRDVPIPDLEVFDGRRSKHGAAPHYRCAA